MPFIFKGGSMKNKNGTHQYTVHGNSVLRLPEIPGLIVLSKYQPNQKKSFWKRLIKKNDCKRVSKK